MIESANLVATALLIRDGQVLEKSLEVGAE